MHNDNCHTGGPINVGERADIDCLDVLPAAAAIRQLGATVQWPNEQPKHFWLNLNHTTRLTWTVHVHTPGAYQAEILIAVAAGTRVTLSTPGGKTYEAAAPQSTWTRLDLGQIELPAGLNDIHLSVDGPGAQVRSLELLPADAVADRQARLRAFQSASAGLRARFADAGWGLMFQYGPWSPPASGDQLPSLDEHVDAFDVDAFVNTVDELGAEYLIWSVTWWQYLFAAPCNAVDTIVPHPPRTARRDLVGEIATALQARGILFFLYYHPGHDAHLGYGSTDWWRGQGWPDEFTRTGRGNRDEFFHNTAAVLCELGERYGDALSGWFLDDGLIFYPAPFEALGASLRAGNPERLISYNSWVLPSFTPFQDVDFGEGRRTLEDLSLDDTGLIRSPDRRDLQAHCMVPLQDDWGIHAPNQRNPIAPWVASELRPFVAEAAKRRVPVSLDILAWHPGVLDSAATTHIADLEKGNR